MQNCLEKKLCDNHPHIYFSTWMSNVEWGRLVWGNINGGQKDNASRIIIVIPFFLCCFYRLLLVSTIFSPKKRYNVMNIWVEDLWTSVIESLVAGIICEWCYPLESFEPYHWQHMQIILFILFNICCMLLSKLSVSEI